MKEITFDVTVGENGHYTGKSRESDLLSEGVTFEEMQTGALVLARAYLSKSTPRPKKFRIAFDQILKLT